MGEADKNPDHATEKERELMTQAIEEGIERRRLARLRDIKDVVHDPVCGMELPGNRLFIREMVGDKTYGFCSEACLAAFDADPTKYTTEHLPPTEPFEGGIHEHITRDPICGMIVDERTALSDETNGKRFYFCSENCRRSFKSL